MVLVAGAGLIGFGAFHVLKLTRGLDDSILATRQQEERFGAPTAFTPRPDGAIPADRMAAFLAVRDALEAPRSALVETFESMPLDRMDDEQPEAMPFREKLGVMLSLGRSAMQLGPRISEFYRARDRAMLERGIEMGEYAYIYTVAYYSWLGHDPSDGPRTDTREEAEGGSHEFRDMARKVTARIQADLTRILANQLASLPEDTPDTWRRALEAEIEAMRREAGRPPWKDGLPDSVSASLAPYRDRLAMSYHPAVNPFELSRSRKRRALSYTSE
ncbi:MAG TPA: hypothetical protein VFP98_05715 [Candidatus Polarisedimenticolia bacterium]|nr:hypothetical protein [Candidatus Polarisedimenticolia bacterium]